MLIVALVLAVIGLAALVTAVVTSNELIAWVCIGASVIGVLLLIVDALRERSRGGAEATDADTDDDAATTVMPAVADQEAAEDYPEEPVDEPAEPAASEPDESDHEPSTVGAEGHDAEATSEESPEAKRD